MMYLENKEKGISHFSETDIHFSKFWSKPYDLLKLKRVNMTIPVKSISSIIIHVLADVKNVLTHWIAAFKRNKSNK